MLCIALASSLTSQVVPVGTNKVGLLLSREQTVDWESGQRWSWLNEARWKFIIFNIQFIY